MKKNSILWAVLPMMAAALLTTACASDDSTDETPAEQSVAKTIPYTVTVGQDEAADTRATVDDDLQTLRFAAGDKLYVTGTNIQGVLAITDGAGTASATFSGNLTYSGEGSPASNLQLTATLVSAQQTEGTQVSVDAAGAVTVNYPNNAYCTGVNDAVQKYSNLTGKSTYGAKSFTLSQQTAFLNFAITFTDGTTTGTELSAVVSNSGAAICTANVTTATESEKVVAKFVLPVAKGTALSSATVTMGEKAAISFGASQTLVGKVYNVTKTRTLIVNPEVGQVIGSDGKNYAADAALPSGVTAVAKICYVGSDNGEAAPYNNGLALAMSDASTGCQWKTANNDAGHAKQDDNTFESESGLQYNATHNTSDYPAFQAAIANNGTSAPTGCSAWFLASGYQWTKMAGAVGGYNKLGLESGGDYWSSSEHSDSNAWEFMARNSNTWYSGKKASNSYRVRSCFAF